MEDFDLYDVLAELGYGLAPRTQVEWAQAFTYKHAAWLAGLPPATTAILKALAGQFTQTSTDSLENLYVFQTREVLRAGGLAALRAFGQPAEVLWQTKARFFAV